MTFRNMSLEENILWQRLRNIFYKESDSRYFRCFSGQVISSQLLKSADLDSTQVNGCSNKTLF